jgi:glycerol-3-phosphate acyltransferase PlsY
MFSIILTIVLSYLLGSCPFSIIITRIWKGIDIRDFGSKNAGFTNVYRVVGPLPAVMVLILDITKGMAAVLLITQISVTPSWLSLIDLKLVAGFFVILGHVFPVFAGFRGGKGIATGLGALLSIIPLEVALALILFVVIVAITRYVSLGSLSATTFVFFVLLFERYYLKYEVPVELIVMIFFLTGLIFFNHRGNIKRLLAGTENKFGQRVIGSGQE